MIGFTRPPCDAGVIRATPAFRTDLSRRRKRLTLAAAILGSSMALIDGSVVNIALPAIQHALHADAASTQWIVNAYLLLLGALVLVGGSAADLYGRRRIFVLGIVVFTIASVACGLAPNISLLIAGRAVQGLGAALLTPASLAMLGATFDDHERSQAIGIWAGVGALTAAAGPVLGGWLVDQVSWRAIFLLNVPLAVAAVVFAIFACESRDPEAKRLDWAGASAVALGLAAITWGLNSIPASGIHDSAVSAALAAGVVSLILFVVIEARSREQAMMPLSLFRSRNFSGTNVLTLLLYFALGGALYYLPFGLIRIGLYSATQAGTALFSRAKMQVPVLGAVFKKLYLSRISRTELHLQSVDLSGEAARIAEEIQRREPIRPICFTIQKQVRALADRRLIQTVLQNLLDNAWKFTSGRDDASIEFGTLPSSDATVCCYVRDNGAGFDPAYASKLFQPFQRLHAARDFPGTGTGLATVRRIVEHHGGHVWAEGAVGAGATFYFTLDRKESE